MVVHGRVQNGVVVCEVGLPLPEGAVVTLSWGDESASQPSTNVRVKFPLIHSQHPGTPHLTGEQVAEFLDEEDVPL
jgi:hypothetical protein